jgi:hypothetical protein
MGLSGRYLGVYHVKNRFNIGLTDPLVDFVDPLYLLHGLI